MDRAFGLQPGGRLAGYRLENEIGRGGMGVVWSALDTRLDRRVALKVLPHELAIDPESLERFEREARAVAAINHPNIVTLYSVEEADGVRFITMELVEGRTLGEIIPADGLPFDRLLELAVPLADAVGSAHARGIIHRDLKPSNLMVTHDGRLKILDFGLAKLRKPDDVEELSRVPTQSVPVTKAGQIMGTAPYMSPEQLHGDPVDHRTDLFSLGVILHEMCTGGRPFRGRTSADLISSIMRDSPRSVSEIRLDLPDRLGRIVRRCLEKEADRRYATAEDLRDVLRELAADAASGTVPGRKRRRRPRRPLLLTAIAVGVLAVVSVALLLWRGAPEESDHLTIAVLPLANLTGEASRDHLGDGISAGIITSLGEVAGIRVLGRSRAWSDQEAGTPTDELARRLGASVLVEGQIQREGGRLRAEVNLTHARSGLVLWSERFEGEEGDLFALQSEIARRVASVLSVPLSPGELRRMAEDPSRSFKVYEHVLRGHDLMRRGGAETLESAVEMFRQAIRLDPEFALAHSGLSEALWYRSRTDGNRETLAEAEIAAQRALQIDPGLPAGRVALARVQRRTGRYAESIDGLQEVLADHPNPDQAQRELAESYEKVGDLEEAERCWRAAVTLGAGDWFNWNELGAFLDRLGNYAEAREAFEKASTLAPNTVLTPHENLAALTIQEGRFDDAIDAYARIPRPIRDPVLASNIGTAYYFSDRPDKWERAEEYYRLAADLHPRSPTIRRNLADLYAEIGRQDLALEQYAAALGLVEEQLVADPDSHDLRLQQALYAAKSGACPTALSAAAELEKDLPQTARNVHKLAHVYALCSQRDAALKAIRTAIDLGVSREVVLQESEFRALHGDPEFQELTEGD